MKRLAFPALAALPLAIAAASTAPADGVEVGEQVDYTFRSPIVGAMGEASLSDFHGKPVLIDFWGTR